LKEKEVGGKRNGNGKGRESAKGGEKKKHYWLENKNRYVKNIKIYYFLG